MIPNYIIKPNPKNNPVYFYSSADHYYEITDGEFIGLHFSFEEITVETDDTKQFINYDYNILYIPEIVNVTIKRNEDIQNLQDKDNTNTFRKIEEIIEQILLEIIKRREYELNTK